MHKAIGKIVTKSMGDGEKKKPLKSLKLKVKFQRKSTGGKKPSKIPAAKSKLSRAMKGYRK